MHNSSHLSKCCHYLLILKIAGRDNNFQKSTKNLTDGFGVDYDFNSVMHYSANAFSVNGKPTIVSKVSLSSHIFYF